MKDIHYPRDQRDLSEIISTANERGEKLEVIGEDSKHRMGRPMRTDGILTTRQLSGVTFYNPEERVISARAGTSLSMIEHTLRHENQQLAFEPMDYGPLLGQRAGLGTIGGVFGANLSGPRRLRFGAARDSLIGIEAVNGRGEPFQNGGRVLKNVAGYDLCKGLSGSWGTLCVYSEVTIRVMPRPESALTLAVFGLDDRLAVNAMCDAMMSPFEITGAAHLQRGPASRLTLERLSGMGESVTMIRLENYSTAVSMRGAHLRHQLSCYGDVMELGDEDTANLWYDLRHLKFFEGGQTPVWRVSTSPQNGPRLVDELSRLAEVSAVYDWSGGLIWLEAPESTDVSAADIRRILAHLGGQATLVRGSEEVRRRMEVFHPVPGALGRLTRGLKQNFDPNRILNPERMYQGV